MTTKRETIIYDVVTDNLALMSKIYQSFEALEQTLGDLQMEEALFMTYAAKKSFAENPHGYRCHYPQISDKCPVVCRKEGCGRRCVVGGFIGKQFDPETGTGFWSFGA